jgi:hypothetical protein
MTNDSSANVLNFGDFLTVVISRQQIEGGDISEPLGGASSTPEPGHCNQVLREGRDRGFGIDDDTREVYEIEEVRKFVYKLDSEFPYWLYFLTKRGTGLAFILSCFCPPFLTPEAQTRIWNEEIADYLSKRGFPALNHFCQAIGCSEEEIRRLSARSTEYVFHGPDVSEV